MSNADKRDTPRPTPTPKLPPVRTASEWRARGGIKRTSYAEEI